MPAAELGIGAGNGGPSGEEGGRGGGPLTLADGLPVGEGGVGGDDLVGTEVGGLEVALESC
jgi:hypothetical protein